MFYGQKLLQTLSVNKKIVIHRAIITNDVIKFELSHVSSHCLFTSGIILLVYQFLVYANQWHFFSPEKRLVLRVKLLHMRFLLDSRG